MPIPPTAGLPPPESWDEFESLALDVVRSVFGEGAQRNGRKGQPQHGIDVFVATDSGWVGLQAKGRQIYPEKHLEVSELKAEVDKALQFEPRLATFILATTAPTDQAIQAAARRISDDHRARGLFEVWIWSWGELKNRFSDEIIKKYWGSPAFSSLAADNRPAFQVTVSPANGSALLNERESYAHLLVRNMGQQLLTKCGVRLTKVERVEDLSRTPGRPIQPRFLRWSSREAAYGAHHQWLDIPPDGNERYLDVAVIDQFNSDGFAFVTADPQDRVRLGCGQYRVVLNLSSESSTPNAKEICVFLSRNLDHNAPASLRIVEWEMRESAATEPESHDPPTVPADPSLNLTTSSVPFPTLTIARGRDPRSGRRW